MQQQKEGETIAASGFFCHPKGEALAMKLAGLQTERIARRARRAELGTGAHEQARRLLVAMIDADDRDEVQRLIARADRTRRSRS